MTQNVTVNVQYKSIPKLLLLLLLLQPFYGPPEVPDYPGEPVPER